MGQETPRQESPRQETGDYFYLSFPSPHTPLPHFPTSPLPHFPTSPLPHSPTSPHPTPHTPHHVPCCRFAIAADRRCQGRN
ncbi:MAG: hypothetical protein LW716_04325 [Microcystis sp. 53602_E8]|nr:hypothetical protein [Microcystis sp. 53602_E8]